jgi:hypothetical protein
VTDDLCFRIFPHETVSDPNHSPVLPARSVLLHQAHLNDFNIPSKVNGVYLFENVTNDVPAFLK